MSTHRWSRATIAAACLAAVALPLAGTAAAAPVPTTAALARTAPDTGAAARPLAQLAPTPPMGWNDWSHYQCGLTEQLITSTADTLVSTGLADKGYRTVTLDDCWMATSRNSSGDLVADQGKFPHGLAWLGSYLHARGLQFGIYEDAGTSTCGGYPGSWGHFAQDAKLFASWGVDYLKLDGCNVPSVSGQTSEQTYRSAYAQQSQALAAAGRDIVFSESAPAYFQGTPAWYTVLGWVAQYGQLWREGYDIATYDPNRPTASRWGSVLGNYDYNHPLARYAGPGHWNDPDFVIAGDPGLTADESRSQTALWAMMAAPLILGADVTALSQASIATLGNADVIAVDQDSLGAQGSVVAQNGTVDVLAKPLAGGDRAVSLLNRGSSATTANTTVDAVGLLGGPGCSYSVKDLWSGATSTSTGQFGATIPAHGTAILRVHPSAGCAAAQPTGQITGPGGKCLDDTMSSTADGSQIILYSCTANPNQRMTLPGDGTVRVLGKCLGAAGGATSAGTAVQLFGCDGSGGQQWSYRQNGNLVNPQSGRCLDASGGGSADGTKIIIWSCGANQANQIWSLPA
ncbi:hypothetical protein F0L68_07955 [Solihabitans fulvus]|uniref:Alpha-galactosidase n=1 Tax=Solihabitans fulvus TaxID=1892852 RepID=A0A5B2XND6_9PSEU|nr:glycoside hydrolase family 27 protein [Solihabitans fulvus]KAA2264342.1 hypothetical protein F0L68_07955 [Solihabitans fulvus]